MRSEWRGQPDTVLLRLNLNRGNGKNLRRHRSDEKRLTPRLIIVDTVYSVKRKEKTFRKAGQGLCGTQRRW